MTRPDLVIFDCDGVLVDSEPISNMVLRDGLTAVCARVFHRMSNLSDLLGL